MSLPGVTEFQNGVSTLSGLLSKWWVTAVLAVPLTLLGWFTLSWMTSPLRKYPGPFLAGYTNFWRFAQASSGRYSIIIKKLHDKYGPVVRIGPNLLDLDLPELVKQIYTTDDRWVKTEFYKNSSSIINGKQTFHIFSTLDPADHTRMKRPIAKYFSISHVLELEPHMNTVIEDLIKHLDKRCDPKEPCDLGSWIAFYAWDLITSATFSRRFGYMDAGHDFDGSINMSDQTADYFGSIGQLPWLDYLLEKNPIVRIGPPNMDNVTRIALESFAARVQGEDPHYDPATPDYLQHFLDTKARHPDSVDDGTIMGYLLVNLLAGADTTAIEIRAVFYFCLKHPEEYRRLAEEVRAAGFDVGAPVSYKAARQLPFLDAVVREAMRLHPSVGMVLERYVPAGGLTLPDGRYVPAGTAVGLNPYVVGRNKEVWGEDADEFRPSRWLRSDGETEDEHKTRLQRINGADLAFGAGARICIGRNIALVEIYKVVATLVNRYDFALQDPDQEWQVAYRWFMTQKGLVTKVSLRK